MATPTEIMGEVKKGRWTPEEDLSLVSYIQERGPHDWNSVPINAGLRRRSKSCKMRWMNYLRPGIKRGNFSPDEERKIVNLQSLFGNRWSAIATHLPQRTDNDIKNYWNAHLKKKLQQQKRNDEQVPTGGSTAASASPSGGRPRRGIWESRLQNDVQVARQALLQALASSPEASSTATPAAVAATVTPAAILPGGFQFCAPLIATPPLMATPPLPSSASGFMGGFKPPSNGSNRFTLPITSNHQLSTGPARIQGSPGHHVLGAHVARLLQSRTESPAPTALKYASSRDPITSNVDSYPVQV